VTDIAPAHRLAAPRKVLACFGTRPEVVKLAPVIEQLSAVDELSVVTATTAQHRQLLDQMLGVFGIEPDIDLGLMRPRQRLCELTGSAVAALGQLIEAERPDAVLVQGDTTTAFCAALAAFYARVPVGHVEAGLRTRDTRHPFPEEINRRLIAPLAHWHFCPTTRSADSLRVEGVPERQIEVTGNTVIDALLDVAGRSPTAEQRAALPARRATRRILVTLHRRETQGEVQRDICRMLARIANRRPDVELLFPVHLSPDVRRGVLAELGGCPRVHLLAPLDYASFVHAMRTSDLIVTDSGGIQEEAPSLDVPVVVLRDTTERPEGLAAGCARLSGTDPALIERDIVGLLDDPHAYARMAESPNPYGDGRAALRIVARLRHDLARPAGADGSREPEPAPTAGREEAAPARRARSGLVV
jgi:UDP-N-acetylglucosamine 2-epimerase (non-hydrolysing)